jgi:hypothetical protein
VGILIEGSVIKNTILNGNVNPRYSSERRLARGYELEPSEPEFESSELELDLSELEPVSESESESDSESCPFEGLADVNVRLSGVANHF